MHRQVSPRDQKNQKTMATPSTTLNWGMSSVRPLTMQLKTRSQLPDLKTSFSQAERYGHHFDKIQPAAISTDTPVQMLSASEEEQNKLMSGVDLGISKSTGNQGVLDKVFLVENQLEKLAHYNKDNTNSPKNFVYKVTTPTETSTSKNKAEDKNSDDHLTSSTKHQVSENKVEDTSLIQDPEVTRLLNKENKNNLSGSGVTPEKKQEKFIAAPSIYDQKKNTTEPKAGTRGQFLAKKEAMNILGDRKGFAATQLAVKKVSVGDSAKSESSTAKDNQDQVKLKNAAELVREQAINDDKQVKEYLRGTFNLEPDIVAKQGGEQLILQKMP
ncbi:hypothetical protein [Nodularia sphaerocarpa]|uniref:hypothetical protein n=1 Tax=Nodularia sphaerocarpa TaxID=137816 RepID=UPI001EFB7356|nr:hypothetical protein [Nodularia sphaerocarpa]MDB9373339.1 hypothetical protein [Nodularia sphaerocarpa CS-585]MDB9378084.1 hypothetical protein [Nodularia sphaerocarpa CS-585A2]ULP71929.1 hypothetical protein BDGGKGIB_01566 [Nodularia sphaerocarpa UHCC 0038]